MSIIARTDVTAVKLYKNFVFAGIGSFVHIFAKESTKLLQRIGVLQGQKIYGFVPSECDDRIIVFGGKQYAVVALESARGSGDVLSRSSRPVLCDDWLHSTVWIDEDTLALLTAHNVVQKWNISKQTLMSQHASEDNSILYSGLLLRIANDVLVLAGTVFSEVIIHRCSDEKPLHNLKGHKGVIFSISCELQKEIIITTSDDRSVRIWGIENKTNCAQNTHDYWENATIVCRHEVYGHMARVMRSCITDFNIVSVGEDSAICFWDYQGNLVRKVTSHQNGSIWSVDSDKEHLVTGGGDGGVILHPLTVASNYVQNEVLHIEESLPKKIMFTARRNIVILNETDNLVYYDVVLKANMVYRLNHESTHKLLSISSCKQIIAVTDMCGNLDVFIENCKDTAYLQNIINTKLQIGKILSMQWAGNRHLVFCSESGVVTVLASEGNKTEVYEKFTLPTCKERWLTASAINSSNEVIILGDRCGNLHVYTKGQRDPIKTFNKVHGRYGATFITIRNNEIVTTGRDGTIKYFSIHDAAQVKYMNSKELDFQWVEKFLSKKGNLICGFQERDFVVYDVTTNSKLLELPCGGGHRSWDAVRYFDKVNENYEEFLKLIYLRNSNTNMATFQFSKIVSKNIVNGSHSKEINCLKIYKTELDESKTFYISGGEDTTLRISSMNAGLHFQDEIVLKQLSGIKTLRTYPLENNQILLISAGGRAQICVKIVKFEKVNNEIKVSSQEVVDYLLKGTDKERKGNQTWRNCSIDFDPETRIMALDIIKANKNDFIVFVGCSDTCLRIFWLAYDSETIFKTIKEIKKHKTCILKTHCIKFCDKFILVTCTTRGEVTFWDITNSKSIEEFDIKPVFTTKLNKSGINGFASRILSNTSLLIASGGDDNFINLNVMVIPNQNDLESISISHTWSMEKIHSSQVTGLLLLDDFLVTTSIDQRITLCKWIVDDTGAKCTFLSQVFSEIADIHGIDLIDYSSDSVTVCVFGKGVEVVTLPATGWE